MDPHFSDETSSMLSNSIGNTSIDCRLLLAEVLQHFLARYPDVFKDELGTLKGFTAKLNVEEDVKPIFCKARPVPLALQEKVDAELARLEKLGL